MKRQKHAVIFDMDGVLIDTSDNTYAFQTILSTYGIDLHSIHDPHGQQWRGGSLVAMVNAIRSQFGVHIDTEELTSRVDAVQYERMEQANTVAHPYLVSFLEELSKNQVRIGIGSASRNQRIQTILKRFGIENYFDVIVGANDVREHKPHPSVYIETALRLGSNVEDCVVIEDTAAGVEAGKRAGMKVVGFLKFQERKDALSAADHLVHDYDGLIYGLISQLINKEEYLLL